MRKSFTALFLSLPLILSVEAFAKNSQKFESSFQETLSGSVKIEVMIGEDLSYRANNLPKKLSDRGPTRRLNSGFSNNGYYGERDLNRLAEHLETKMARRLSKKGVTVSDTASKTLRLTITDAKPNRPTFEQLSREPSLSFKSFGIGGASFEGQLISASGESIGDISYAWYENDFEDAAFSGTWTDAKRAMDFFTRKTAKKLN